MHPAGGRRVRLRGLHERQRPVPVVGAGENHVDVGEPSRSLQEVLDALLGRDPADVEDDRRAVGNDARKRIAVGRRRRLGEGVRADPDPARVDARRDDVVALLRRRHDDEARALHDAARHGGVEQALQGHLPQPRREHPDGLEEIGDATQPAPRGDTRCDRVAEAHHMRHVGPRQAAQLERQRRRDPHPAVAQRRRQVRHARAVDRLDPRAPAGSPRDVRQRRRHHLDVVTARGEPRDQLARNDDGASERVGRPVRGAREQDAHVARTLRRACVSVSAR